MFFSIWFRRGGKPRRRFEFENPGEKFIRMLLFVALLGGVCWAFWQHSDNYVQKFKAEARISDDAELLSPAHKAEIAQILSRIEQNFGVELRVKISLVPLLQTDSVPKAMLFGVCPGFKQCVFLMPEAWRQGLGESFLIYLAEELMRPAFIDGNWQAATVEVLKLLEQRMQQLAGGNGEAPAPVAR